MWIYFENKRLCYTSVIWEVSTSRILHSPILNKWGVVTNLWAKQPPWVYPSSGDEARAEWSESREGVGGLDHVCPAYRSLPLQEWAQTHLQPLWSLLADSKETEKAYLVWLGRGSERDLRSPVAAPNRRVEPKGWTTQPSGVLIKTPEWMAPAEGASTLATWS